MLTLLELTETMHPSINLEVRRHRASTGLMTTSFTSWRTCESSREDDVIDCVQSSLNLKGIETNHKESLPLLLVGVVKTRSTVFKVP